MVAQSRSEPSPVAAAYRAGPPSPKYQWLRELIREEYASWDSGTPIPSEAELCQTHGVSRTTVRKALDDLANQGLLYRVQGKGTFVAATRVPERFVQFTAGFYEDMIARGIPFRTEVLEQAVVEPPKDIAGKLRVALGELAVKIRRLRYVNNHPVLLSDSYVPLSLFPGIDHEDLRDASLYATLREKYGAKLARGTRYVTAASCSEEQGRLLNAPPGSPLLVISGVMVDTVGRLIEAGTAWLRGDFAEVEIAVVSR